MVSFRCGKIMRQRINNKDIITLSYGGGGIRTKHLISEIIATHLWNPILNAFDDAALLKLEKGDIAFTTDSYVVDPIFFPGGDIAFTTDSYVVDPIFFPGGDIGRLAVSGTVNDLVMMGAKPLYLSLGLIIEEGLAVEDLEKIILSIKRALGESGTKVVTGDTKVVERGRGHSIFINTSGIGIKIHKLNTSVTNARIGDAVIISGSIGDHSTAIIAQRRGLKLESNIRSDVAPLWKMLQPLLTKYGRDIHVLRDPTRGGLSAALCDIAESSNVGIRVFEEKIPIKSAVKGLCALTGIDPMTMANEGKAVIVCQKKIADKVVAILKRNQQGKDAAIIVEIVAEHKGIPVMQTVVGGERIIRMPLGEELPRIC